MSWCIEIVSACGILPTTWEKLLKQKWKWKLKITQNETEDKWLDPESNSTSVWITSRLDNLAGTPVFRVRIAWWWKGGKWMMHIYIHLTRSLSLLMIISVFGDGRDEWVVDCLFAWLFTISPFWLLYSFFYPLLLLLLFSFFYVFGSF